MCAKAIDIGTCFLVGVEQKDGKEIFTTERDAFFSMPNEDFAEEMLTKAGAFYLTKGEEIYVVGEDALKFSLVTGNQDDYRRPMARGVLNPGEEEAISMLEVIIEAVIGKPSYDGEVVAVTNPAAPIDADFDVVYHRMILERFLKKLGYNVKIINEGMAIIYSENPIVKSDEGVIPFTGIGISFGAGMVNLAASWRAKKLLEFSCTRGGDWIDMQVAKVRNLPQSRVTALKEKKLDFTNLDESNQTLVAIDIYYEDLIKYVLENFRIELKRSNTTFGDPVELIVAGGAASAPGFVDKLTSVLGNIELPFEIKNVRLAKDPLKSVASGALIAAITQEKRATSRVQKKNLKNKNVVEMKVIEPEKKNENLDSPSKEPSKKKIIDGLVIEG